MFGKKRKKKRVCRDCGFISRNFPERKVRHGFFIFMGDVVETEYQCPECGSKDVKTFDYVLEEIVEKEYENNSLDEVILEFPNEVGPLEGLSNLLEANNEARNKLENLLHEYPLEEIVSVLDDVLKERVGIKEEKKLKSMLKEIGYSPGAIKKIMNGDVDG